jgi:hypothetical protein
MLRFDENSDTRVYVEVQADDPERGIVLIDAVTGKRRFDLERRIITRSGVGRGPQYGPFLVREPLDVSA